MTFEPTPAAGVYLHFPFCSERCTYCDFPTVAGRDDRIEIYLEALVREIATGQTAAPRRVDTVFLGGGTPSRMKPAEVRRVLEAIQARFDVAADAEITLEGNPESLSLEKLRGYRAVGITRISIGVQSLDDAVLARAGRVHDAREAGLAVGRARAGGFHAVSVDLIAGLPGEDMARWGETVSRVAALGPDHVSVYLLETDKDTPLGRSVRAGRTAAPDDDTLAEAYRRTVDTLDRAGFPAYEISNFARDGSASRHNLKYWTDAPYAAFGVGAHAYIDGERRSNRRDVDGYIADVLSGNDPADWREPWDRARRLVEALFLGLRLTEGVDLEIVGRRYDSDPWNLWRSTWERAEDAGILVREGSRVRLTSEGRIRSNELFAELV